MSTTRLIAIFIFVIILGAGAYETQYLCHNLELVPDWLHRISLFITYIVSMLLLLTGTQSVIEYFSKKKKNVD